MQKSLINSHCELFIESTDNRTLEPDKLKEERNALPTIVEPNANGELDVEIGKRTSFDIKIQQKPKFKLDAIKCMIQQICCVLN